MADTDAVRGAGLADRLPATPPGGGVPASGSPASEPGATMTLVDHLTELRDRIVRSILAVVVGTAIGFLVYKPIQTFLTTPLPPANLPLQTLGPGDAFGIALQISVIVGIILAMPVLLYQLWSFVSPGLTPTERRALRPWIPLALFFFLLGVVIAWIVLPFAMGFLLGFTSDIIVANLTATAYFGFVTTMFLAFGLLMEFPILLYALARVGILSSARLTQSRRITILGIAIFAAVVTPGGDPFSPLVLGGTMYVLYELTVLAIRRSGR
jgi:sec-independent protein translocase protein TatC